MLVFFSKNLDLFYIFNYASSDEVTACKRILEKVGLKGYQVCGPPTLFFERFLIVFDFYQRSLEYVCFCYGCNTFLSIS